MSTRLISVSFLCTVFVLSNARAFALGPTVSQAPLIDQTGQSDSTPQAEHSVGPAAGSPGTSAGAEDTLTIPHQFQTIPDPLAPVNEKSFSLNQNIDRRAFHPIANLWSRAVPKPAQACIVRFFDNTGVVPRFTNALLQLKFKWAGGELARFGINSTLGVAGLFDPAQFWFGLKEHDNSFGLTLAAYGMTRGFYLMPPVGGPIDVREVVGGVVDGAMNPMNYLVPGSVVIYKMAAHSIEGLNSRAQKQSALDDVDHFAIDKYGAVQDAYVQKQTERERAVIQGGK